MQLRVFLSELKRRQVYRAMLIYATIAWVLLEGADIVFPRLGFAHTGEACHPFHLKPATRTGAKLPPIGA